MRERHLGGMAGRMGHGVMTRSMTKALAREREKQVQCGGAGNEATSAGCARHAPGSSKRQRNCSMRARLWSKLPQELVERIAARLPAATATKLRAVSRRWNAILHGSDAAGSFLHLYQEAESERERRGERPPAWFCMFTKIHLDSSTYDAAGDRWHNLPLPLLPHRNFVAAAAHGGLVCFCSFAAGRTEDFVVCNPLSGARWRLEPVPLRARFSLQKVGLVADGRSKTFRVVAAGYLWGGEGLGHGFREPRTEVFHSGTRRWESVASPHPDTMTDCLSPVLLPEGVLLWFSGCGGRSVPDALVGFHLELGLWTHSQVRMPGCVVCRTLVEWQGGVFMLGGLHHAGMTRHICVWRLRRDAHLDAHGEVMEWEEVDRMPAMLCAEFIGESTHVNFTPAAAGLVLLTMRGGSRNRLMVLYDVATRVWRRVPKCPLPDHRLVWGLKDGIAFQPRLDADLYFRTCEPDRASATATAG